MTRSVVEILIATIRAQAEATLTLESLLADRADEFTIARARRIVLDSALPANLTLANPVQPEPPTEPPPRAA